jgi:hypothetical protein
MTHRMKQVTAAVAAVLISAGPALIATTAEAVPGTPPTGASSDPWLKSPGLSSAPEQEKPEAGGRVIKRAEKALPGSSPPQKSPGISGG